MPPYSLPPTPLEQSRRKELRTRIKLCQGTRSARRRLEAELEESEQRRNLPLPPELMGMIFDFYVHLYGQIPERLLLVCHAWHVLALSQPALWTNLDPLGPFGLSTARPWAGTFLQSRIKRSDPYPLKVDFSRWSQRTQPEDVKKIASLRTFRSRIQELVISNNRELHYLIGSQPLLKRLSIGGRMFPLDELSENPGRYMLPEKTITTLRLRPENPITSMRLHSPPEMHTWPESLLRRLQTLEVTLTGIYGRHHECWSTVQKSVALLTLRVNLYHMSAPPLFHPSCRNLTIAYCDSRCSVEEVRMPLLQELTITNGYNALTRLTLVDTPVSSLRLTCKWSQFETIGQAERTAWVGGAIRLLRSTPRLKRLEIIASFGLVASLSEAIANDSNLCMELHTFIIDRPAGIGLEPEGHGRNVEANFEQLRSKISALINQRRLCQSKN